MMNYLDLNTYSTSGLEFRDVAIKPINEKYSINHSGLIYNKLDGVYINTSLCGIPKYHYFSATYTPRDGKQYRKTLRVHRVIAMTFIGECPVDGHVVDHIDRDRYNNHYTNLRWISRCDNIRNSDRGDLVSKDIPVDNEVRCDVKYKGVSSKRSKSGSYIVTCNKDIIGYANNDEFAAKMYDTAARMTYKDPYLNFPYVCLDESTIFNTHRRGIKRSLFVYINTSLCGVPKYHYFCASYTPLDDKVKPYRKTLRVHRVIAMTFIGECPVDGHVVDHIDRDRYNNHYTNLRWISRSANIRNSDRGDSVSKGIPVDNEVRWDVKYKGVSSKRSKSGSYIVTCNKDIIGYANNDEFAAKMYDTAARMTYKDPYLNFPYVCLDESTIFNTHRRGIKRSLFVYINKRSISNTILLKIQYRYKHEYLNKCDIVRQYSISLYTVNKILEGVDSKVDKKSLFSKKLMRQTNRDIEIIRWKYLALELYNDKSNNYTKKQIAGIVGEPIRVVVKYLPTRCSQQNSLDKKLIPKVLEMYSTGEYTQVELAKIFNTTRSIIGNIIHGRVVV